MSCSGRRGVRSLFLLAACALGGLLVSCQALDRHTSVVWTNIPGVLTFVDRFNASQKRDQLLIEYRDHPSRALTSGPLPDLIIAHNLASSERKDMMADLGFLFDEGSLSQASLYRHILEAGQQGGQQRLMPVSFDLPIVIFSKKQLPNLPGFSLNGQQIRDLNSQFNASIKEPGRRLAFSPLWADAGLTWLALRGVSFHESFSGDLSWNPAALTETVKWIDSWPQPSREIVHEFQKKYLVTDVTSFLDSGRIQFYPSTLATFLARPWDERRSLDFRYVDQGGKLFAADNVIWAAIPERASNPEAARAFLRWFFRADVQNAALKTQREQDPREFGLAEGLSSLIDVNARYSQSFTELQGRVPGADQVLFWATLPPSWSELKASVLNPWLSSANHEDPSLRVALERKRRQDTIHSSNPQP